MYSSSSRRKFRTQPPQPKAEKVPTDRYPDPDGIFFTVTDADCSSTNSRSSRMATKEKAIEAAQSRIAGGSKGVYIMMAVAIVRPNPVVTDFFDIEMSNAEPAPKFMDTPASLQPVAQDKNWLRIRFKTRSKDYRPLTYPPPGPYWHSNTGPDHHTLIAYVRKEEDLFIYWPEAYDLETPINYEAIEFSERFPEPQWWKKASQVVQGEQDTTIV